MRYIFFSFSVVLPPCLTFSSFALTLNNYHKPRIKCWAFFPPWGYWKNQIQSLHLTMAWRRTCLHDSLYFTTTTGTTVCLLPWEHHSFARPSFKFRDALLAGNSSSYPLLPAKSFWLSFCPSSFLFDFRTYSPEDLWLQGPLIASVPHNVNLVLEYNYTRFFLVSKLYLFFLEIFSRVKVVFQILIYSQFSILIFIVSTYKRVANFVFIWHKGAEFSYIFALVMRNL